MFINIEYYKGEITTSAEIKYITQCILHNVVINIDALEA